MSRAIGLPFSRCWRTVWKLDADEKKHRSVLNFGVRNIARLVGDVARAGVRAGRRCGAAAMLPTMHRHRACGRWQPHLGLPRVGAQVGRAAWW